VEPTAPASKISLTRDLARFVGLYVGAIEGAASVDVTDRGKGHFDLAVYDKSGFLIETRKVGPGGLDLSA